MHTPSPIATKSMIPSQILLTGSPQHLTSQEIQSSLRSLQDRNSGWSIKIFSDEQQLDFIEKNCAPDIIESYLRLNPRYGAAKADLFRYIAIYVLGGVYLDIKSSCLLPFSAILRGDDSLVLAQWDNQIGRPYEGWGLSPDVWDVAGGEYVNWFFAAEPKNPILLEVIKLVLHQINTYEPKANNKGRIGILRVTGPLAWTRAIISMIRKHKTDINYRVRIVNMADEGLVYSIFDKPKSHNGLMRHRGIFRDHYSASDEPVVLGKLSNGA